jgi:UDP-3-O-[3-hydroxymyristoyl] glucosamine N-acyltransferase
MDELRDYRFFNDDMVHPSPLAVTYVWERFSAAMFTDETMRVVPEIESINRALEHRPLHPDSDKYKHFLEQTQAKITAIKKLYPSISF